ncbi:MAG: hypothetical protein HKN26_00560 [Acidimicrobiales bacterium]|nr:hypothetical protein [Acidimicrobiales bacterium]
MTTLYYDPTLDIHHRLPVFTAGVTSFYAAPQEPLDAQRLWEAACASHGFNDELHIPIPAGRAYGASQLLAREWGDAEMDARLSEAIEASYEPTWDDDRGEFTWGLGLNEPHPRGQFNAFLAAAEASDLGMWERLSSAPIDPCPQIVGVDFPTMALRRADWVNGALQVSLAPVRDNPEQTTTFTVRGVEGEWTTEGSDGTSVESGPDGLIVTARCVTADLEIRPAG